MQQFEYWFQDVLGNCWSLRCSSVKSLPLPPCLSSSLKHLSLHCGDFDKRVVSQTGSLSSLQTLHLATHGCRLHGVYQELPSVLRLDCLPQLQSLSLSNVIVRKASCHEDVIVSWTGQAARRAFFPTGSSAPLVYWLHIRDKETEQYRQFPPLLRSQPALTALIWEFGNLEDRVFDNNVHCARYVPVSFGAPGLPSLSHISLSAGRLCIRLLKDLPLRHLDVCADFVMIVTTQVVWPAPCRVCT